MRNWLIKVNTQGKVLVTVKAADVRADRPWPFQPSPSRAAPEVHQDRLGDNAAAGFFVGPEGHLFGHLWGHSGHHPHSTAVLLDL